MRSSKPMNRLLQGEVGSGKTVLACYAILTCIQSGYQAALMVPTEILAGQHFLVLNEFIKDLPVRIALLTSAVKGTSRQEIIEGLKKGEIDLVVGTHALIEEELTLPSRPRS